ncbi:hypothetical protein H4R34_001178 [Dimargaris verticillata]|uniref:Non-structural maintenance of chromosomes element 1 homolog n=1 Tax=Dimargaris verticillata TaxID=2761393 RepID=A0A9W8B4X4_9FUNG|nr:hypothetical protein H4R34_001178 [Dimargaris verticillata]
MAYGDSHRLFLQNMLLVRCTSQAEVERLHAQANNQFPDAVSEPLDTFIGSINGQLDCINLELRSTLDETAGDRVWALVNTKGDEIAKLATNYSPAELNAFKHVIELIVNAEDGNFSIASSVCLNETHRQLTSNTKMQTQDFLKQLVRDQWLTVTDNGYYVMAPRTVLELQTYLQDEYGELIRPCYLCKDIVTKGQRCDNDGCETVMHLFCANRYIPVHNNDCPQCGQSWDRCIEFGDQVHSAGQLEQSRIAVSRSRASLAAEASEAPMANVKAEAMSSDDEDE